jgi:hypothetical protein
MMRRLTTALVILTAAAAPAAAQSSLSDQFSHLFTFGSCGEPLCLDVNAAVHGQHFNPDIVQGENNLLGFLTGAIATSLGNLPFTAASGGVTFRFENGVPVATSVSAGPIYGERAQTLGRGRVLFGMNLTGISMDNIRGVPLNDLNLVFTHQNVGDPALGDPEFERDIIEVNLDMQLKLLVTSVFASVGLADNLDLGVLVPLVRASLTGSSQAQVVPFDRPTPHQFGTQSSQSDVATSSSDASATGIGDIALRLKANLFQGPSLGFGAIADVRLPTGAEEDFLGSGATNVRVLGVLSGRSGNFSPHLNAGFAYRSGTNQNNSMLATIGFDHLLSESVSIAADVITDLELGESKLLLPEPVVFTAPTVTTVSLTDIPNQKDNFVDASFGMKAQLPGDIRAVANILFPLADAGLSPKFLWTFGFERTF